MSVSDSDYHLTFGLHSGIPLCCAILFSEGGRPGPCPKCREGGVDRLSLHTCNVHDSCQPYLDLVELRTIAIFHHWLSGSLRISTWEGDSLQSDSFGWDLARPVGKEFEGILEKEGFRVTHTCLPEPHTYWYIAQKGSPEGVCAFCDEDFTV